MAAVTKLWGSLPLAFRC